MNDANGSVRYAVEYRKGEDDVWCRVLPYPYWDDALKHAMDNQAAHPEWQYRITRTDTGEVVSDFRSGAAPQVTPSGGDLKVSKAGTKVPLQCLALRALQGEARVRQYGARKYAPGNYIKASVSDGAIARYVGALLRHVELMQGPGGQYTPESAKARDAESGLPHIDHAICSLTMLREILIEDGVLPADPGEGKEPLK